jgi:excisionase family DNA binding protein
MAYLTPRQLATQWQCSASHVRRLCRRGELQAMRLGSDWRISAEAAAAYEAAHTTRRPDVTFDVTVRKTGTHTAYGFEFDGGALPDRWWEQLTNKKTRSATH